MRPVSLTPEGAGGAPDSPAARPPTPPPVEPLPDLVLDAAYLIDTTVEDVIEVDDPCQLDDGCVSGLGTRRVVRFGSRTGNVGSADLVLGSRQQGNPYWTPNACNGSVDLVGFARYELRDQASGALVARGAKNGFCIADSEPWDLASEQSCERYSCQDQGISRGCSDSYGFVLECQWVDITAVAPGQYTLRVTINADRAIPELDYANDVVEVGLAIGEDSVLVQR